MPPIAYSLPCTLLIVLPPPLQPPLPSLPSLRWAVFFQLFTLIFLAVAYYTRRGSNKLGLMVTLAMVTTLFFVVTNNAFTVVKSSSGALRSSTEAFAAGAILTMMANLLIIFVLGDDMSSAVAAPEPYLNSNPASSVQMSGAKPTSSAMV